MKNFDMCLLQNACSYFPGKTILTTANSNPKKILIKLMLFICFLSNQTYIKSQNPQMRYFVNTSKHPHVTIFKGDFFFLKKKNFRYVFLLINKHSTKMKKTSNVKLKIL